MDTAKYIAVIGMSGRFPGADNLQEFWTILAEGQSVFTHFSDENLREEGISTEISAQPNYKKIGGILNNIEKFDANFFDIPAREALVLDPQQRLFMEGCWEALEMAGYSGANTSRSVGVFAGASMNAYWMHNLAFQPAYVTTAQGFQSLLGNEKDYLATRVAYKLNLQGPAVTVQTACSTSMVAIHMACQNLLLGECDMALAGGVSIKVPHKAGYLYQEGLPFSADGSCRAFDKDGSGTVFGSGMGVVLLKPYDEALEDGDPILAVIRGSTFNNDGNRKIGFTAPSELGQQAALKVALHRAEVDPASVTYIEAHGTGTQLGDPIEVSAIQQAYEAAGAEPCAIGSVKSNIGHLETAAGVSGFIKTVLMLQHQKLLPAAGFKTLNPLIELDNSRLYINTQLKEWQPVSGVRRAAVSSFGMGGTNVHLVLQEAPEQVHQHHTTSASYFVLPLSAKSQLSLDTMTTNLKDWLVANPKVDISSLAFSLQQRKAVFPFKRTLVTKDITAAIDLLQNRPEKMLSANSSIQEQVIFLYAGAGTQYANMGRDLYQSQPIYSAAIDYCADFLKPLLGVDIRNYIFVEEGKLEVAMQELQAVNIMFPAIFCTQYALTLLIQSWGIRPAAAMGHSHGEYMVAWLSGVMSIETALTLVAKRATLMLKLLPGAMAVVPVSLEQVRNALADSPICIAAINSDQNTVISGSVSDIETATRYLQKRLKVEVKNLHVKTGLHSKLTDSIYEEFLSEVKQHRLLPPSKLWVSSISGDWITADQVCQASYWADHMRNSVHFMNACKKLHEKYPDALFVDMGPGRVAGELFRKNAENLPSVVSPFRNFQQNIKDTECALEAIAKLWLLGFPVNWGLIYSAKHKTYLPGLPTYPFDRQRYWVTPPAATTASVTAAAGIREPDIVEHDAAVSETKENSNEVGVSPRPQLMTPFVEATTETQMQIKKIWQDFFGVSGLGIYDNFIELGGTSLLATEVNSAIKVTFKVDITLAQFLEAGSIFELANKITKIRREIDEQIMLELLTEFETSENP